MAYDEYLADRIRRIFKQKNTPFEEKRMMGGLCFMVDGKMCVGADKDKRTNKNRLMARLGEHVYEDALNKPGCSYMDITGKPLTGFVLVGEEAIDQDSDLEYWIQLCLDFNPLAKRSKK